MRGRNTQSEQKMMYTRARQPAANHHTFQHTHNLRPRYYGDPIESKHTLASILGSCRRGTTNEANKTNGKISQSKAQVRRITRHRHVLRHTHTPCVNTSRAHTTHKRLRRSNFETYTLTLHGYTYAHQPALCARMDRSGRQSVESERDKKIAFCSHKIVYGSESTHTHTHQAL